MLWEMKGGGKWVRGWEMGYRRPGLYWRFSASAGRDNAGECRCWTANRLFVDEILREDSPLECCISESECLMVLNTTQAGGSNSHSMMEICISRPSGSCVTCKSKHSLHDVISVCCLHASKFFNSPSSLLCLFLPLEKINPFIAVARGLATPLLKWLGRNKVKQSVERAENTVSRKVKSL